MLQARNVVASVRPPHINLQGRVTHRPVGMVEEVVEDIEDGRLGNYKFLQVLRVELVAVHVNGRKEDALHLVVSELVGGLVGGDQHLSGPEGNARMLATIEGREFGEAVGQFIRETGFVAPQVVNEHRHQQILFGDLAVGKDGGRHSGHVVLVLLSQQRHAFVVRT